MDWPRCSSHITWLLKFNRGLLRRERHPLICSRLSRVNPFQLLAQGKMQRLLIVAGELSGDLHAAKLAKALQQADSSLMLLGVGGRNMKDAGVELIHGTTHLDVVGTLGLQQARAVLRTYSVVRRFLKNTPPGSGHFHR